MRSVAAYYVVAVALMIASPGHLPAAPDHTSYLSIDPLKSLSLVKPQRNLNSEDKSATSALTIVPGDDLWLTPPGLGTEFRGFETNPIPADFFGPGSDPFDGVIELQGQPLRGSPPTALGPSDCIIRRIDPADLPAPGSTAQIDIEIVALSLTSVAPITVTFNGGNTSEDWNVDMSLSSQVPQIPGIMDIHLDCPEGGAFSATLPVTPRFVFTNVADQAITVELDPPTGLAPMTLALNNVKFSRCGSFTPPVEIFTIPPGTTVDHDNNPLTPDVSLIATACDFIPGLAPLPCDPDADVACPGVTPIQTEIVEMTLTSFPPLIEPPTMGATCLPDGGCVLTDPSCATTIGGEYQGDGTICQPLDCLLAPAPGVTFEQVDFLFDGATQLASKFGRFEVVDPAALAADFLVDSGYINVYTDRGWVIQNMWFNSADGHVSTYFDLTVFEGTPVSVLSAHVDLSPTATLIFPDGFREGYGVQPFGFNAEGADGGVEVTFLGEPITPGSMPFEIAGLFERHTQPNKGNVQAAESQCAPMSVANSLQYLEDRYGLDITDNHVEGLGFDGSLVGELERAMERGFNTRDDGSGVSVGPGGGRRGMVAGKFNYLRRRGLENKLIQRHQGSSSGRNSLPPGDFTSEGVTSTDESVDGKVTFEWICEHIQKGEDVEVNYGHYDGTTRNGGHSVRVFECGKTFGIPWLGYVHDATQNDDDPGDSLGLECVREFMFDMDGDGQPNLGQVGHEIDFAFSESADNDQDGVPQGLDNAPDHYNPGQEDYDSNDTGDVAESDLRSEDEVGPWEVLVAGSSQPSSFFANPKPDNPDHKDLWFNGRAKNVAGGGGRITVCFGVQTVDGEVEIESGDTTNFNQSQFRGFFGATRLDFCPDSVRVIIKILSGDYINVSGTLSHICYEPAPAEDCCVTPGDADNNGRVNIADITFLIARIFAGGPAPPCADQGDADGNNKVNIADITYLIARIFAGGPAPVCGTTGI